jgi:hypothetical protein
MDIHDDMFVGWRRSPPIAFGTPRESEHYLSRPDITARCAVEYGTFAIQRASFLGLGL